MRQCYVTRNLLGVAVRGPSNTIKDEPKKLTVGEAYLIAVLVLTASVELRAAARGGRRPKPSLDAPPRNVRTMPTPRCNKLVRNHQQGSVHCGDGFVRERSPRKQRQNSAHLEGLHRVLEAP
jgi:hypothetical protein